MLLVFFLVNFCRFFCFALIFLIRSLVVEMNVTLYSMILFLSLWIVITLYYLNMKGEKYLNHVSNAQQNVKKEYMVACFIDKCTKK